jgi:hypothetical protein
MWKDEVQPPSRPSHFSVWHLSLRNSFTSSKQCCVFSFAQMFHSYGRAYHTYNHDLSLSTNTTYTEGFYFIVMLFLYYCMVFNQIVHSLVKEPLHILARRLSLRNAIIIGILHLHPLFFQKCVTILKEILQKVMLYRTFPHFRMQSTASIQGLFETQTLSKYYLHLSRHSMPKQCCIFLKECPTMFKECITLFNGPLQKSNATLQLVSKSTTFFLKEYCVD